MQASRAGDRFVVEVSDDGRGIDPDDRPAQGRGTRVAADATNWPRCPTSRSIDLIFSAGFSTAAEVSDISGRGVGMDVVRPTVEQIGGRVSLTSRVGAGTTVRLDLPDEHRDVAHHGGGGRRTAFSAFPWMRSRKPFA